MRCWLIFLICGPGFGQAFTAGVTGGVPVTDTFNAGYVFPDAAVMEKTIRYTIGPSVDFRLAGPLRLEIDALYQPFSFRTYIEGGASAPTYSHYYGSLWKIPALLKYRIRTPVLRPFVDAGPSVQLASNITSSTYDLIQRTPVVSHPGSNDVAGLSTGGGVEFHLGPMMIVPEARYTRWFGANFRPFVTTGRGSNLNELEILVSIRVGPRP